MNPDRVKKIIDYVNQNNHYEEFPSLFSFEIRNYLLENFNQFNFPKELIAHWWTEEEALMLYTEGLENYEDIFQLTIVSCLNRKIQLEVISSLPASLKIETICLFEDDALKIKYLSLANADYEKAYILSSLKSDSLKLEYAKILNDDANRFSVLETLVSDEAKIEALSLFSDSYKESCQTRLLESLSKDELKLKYVDVLQQEHYKAIVLETLTSDELKLKAISLFKDRTFQLSMVTHLKSDALKLKCLDFFEDDIFLGRSRLSILSSLESDSLKLSYFLENKDPELLFSIKSDKIKAENLQYLKDDEERKYVIRNFYDNGEKIKAYNMYPNAMDVDEILYWEDLQNIKIMYPAVLEKIADYYSVSSENLIDMVKSFGYNVIPFLENKNICDALCLNKEEFSKYMQMFTMQKAKPLSMQDVDNIVETLLQREFRFANKEVFSLFPTLKSLIENGKKKEALELFYTVFEHHAISSYLSQKNQSLEPFLEKMVNGEEEAIHTLHELVMQYIEMQRKNYLKKRQQEVNTELKLEKSYEKNYLIERLFIVESDTTIVEMLQAIDENELEEAQKELVKDPAFLQKCLYYRKNAGNTSIPLDVKKKLKTLNQLLSILYLNKQLTYLGRDKEHMKVHLPTKELDPDAYLKVMQEIHISNFQKNILQNPHNYQDLIELLSTYHFFHWQDIFENLFMKSDLEFDESNIASIINYFPDMKKDLEEKKEAGLLKEARLIHWMDESMIYGAVSSKYKYILGNKNYSLFASNPGPNASNETKAERLRKIPTYMQSMYERKYITIPPTMEQIELESGVKIKIEVGNVTSTDNLTYGEKTGACMRVGGVAESLYEFCIQNENGFHIAMKDANTDELISRVSGFRNGNTIFLNQLRTSLDKRVTDKELVEILKSFTEKIREKTRGSEHPIDNVIISGDLAMGSFGKHVKLDVNPKQGYGDFYSDVSKENAVFLNEDNTEIKLGPNEVEYYPVTRKKIEKIEDKVTIREKIIAFQMLNTILQKEDLENFKTTDLENILDQINSLYVGEDFYILSMEDGTWLSYILKRDSYFMEQAEKEVKEFLQRHTLKEPVKSK